MLSHFRRILLALAIFLVAGWLYKEWRDEQGGYGLFDLLRGDRGPADNAIETHAPKLQDSDIPGIAQLDREFSRLAESVLPSVVSINTATVKRERVGIFLGYQTSVVPGLGSGVIVTQDGHILTNNHVVAGTNQILVTTNDQQTYQAEVVGADAALDIAVLKIVSDRRDFPGLGFADSDTARVGQIVFAVGNPFGLSGTVTQGIIGATQRRFSDTSRGMIQTDTVINPGNSGGPLVNIRGEIIGINVAIFAGNEKVQAWQGVGLAIPANDVRDAFTRIMEQGPPRIGYLGITLEPQPVSVGFGFDAALGVVIEEVLPGSPAASAGLRQGDIILGLNGRPLETPDEVFLIIRGTPPGQDIIFTILRDGKTLTPTATLAPRP